MILKKCILTRNDCYNKGTRITKLNGIVVHSTGANNTTLKRYVQPLETDADYAAIIADIGKNKYDNHWNKSYKAGECNRQVCVHGFIGTNAAGVIETYQTLPFDICCWGVGSGSKGSYNYNPTARIQFEICEDDCSNAEYFAATFKEAAEFCAYLCKTYDLGVEQICSHAESYKAGYGGNHGDPDHWLKKFGKNMDWFRAEVEKLLKPSNDGGGTTTDTPPITSSIKVGDLVRIKAGATYYSGQAVPRWVANQNWYVRNVKGERVVIDKNESGTNAICSPVNIKDLQLVRSCVAEYVPAVGDVVIYNGNVHYSSANSTVAKSCKGGRATVTKIYKLGTSKHPYHLIKESGGGSTVYGWVDVGTFRKE